MADVTINYQGSTIATMDASGSKTLNTQGKYCEGDIGVAYVKPASPTGTKQITITANGTTTEDVTNYANAQITANVPNSYSAADEGKVASNGALVAQTSDTVTANGTYDTTLINSLTVNVSGGGGGLSGTFTPASNLYSYTITELVGTTKEHVLIKAQGNLNNGRNGSNRSTVQMYFEWGTNINSFCIYTNSGGTSLSGIYAYGSISSGNTIYFDRDTGKVTVKSTIGYMLSGVTFDWFAW